MDQNLIRRDRRGDATEYLLDLGCPREQVLGVRWHILEQPDGPRLGPDGDHLTRCEAAIYGQLRVWYREGCPPVEHPQRRPLPVQASWRDRYRARAVALYRTEVRLALARGQCRAA